MGKFKKTVTGKDKLHKTLKDKSKSKKVSKKIQKQNVKRTDKTLDKLKEEPSKRHKTNVDYTQVQNGIEVLMKYDEKIASNNLFNEERTIYLQFRCIKIPVGPSLRLRFSVKHSLVTDKSEICLIVPDLKRGRKRDHEPTIEYYEEFLKSKGVTCIKRIIPFRQLKVEYDVFELKRRLFGFCDIFLVDGRISGHVSHFLGKTFYKSAKMPIPIHLGSLNLKGVIDKALSKVQLNLRCNGDSYVVPVGHTNMTSEMILQNVKRIIKCLSSYFPGGWENIRGLYIKTKDSLAVPLYITLKSANEVPVPIIKEKRPKLYKTLTDELSTQLNKDVIVEPTGEVQLVRKSKKSRIAVEPEKKLETQENIKYVELPVVFQKITSLKKRKTKQVSGLTQ